MKSSLPDVAIDFKLLHRELQQRIPNQLIFSHLDRMLLVHSPVDFQIHFLSHVTGPIDSKLLQKVSAHLFARFDRIYEGAKYALDDRFVQFLCSQQSDIEKEDICNRYFPTGRSILHITSSESLVSSGTTGYSLWEASVALLALLSFKPCTRKWFKDKRVLELGSGTGLGGLAVAAMSDPKSVLLTDVSQVHDSFTFPNLKINFSTLSMPVSSKCVFWDDLSSEPLNFCSNFDVILGCDLVYDPDVCPLLLSALKALLLSTTSTISTVILLCTLRNPQTFHEFLKELNNEINFRVEMELLDELPVDCDIILSSIESFRLVIIHNKKQQNNK